MRKLVYIDEYLDWLMIVLASESTEAVSEFDIDEGITSSIFSVPSFASKKIKNNLRFVE